jgi:AbrB family looped-hinge helix DNA binding protein
MLTGRSVVKVAEGGRIVIPLEVRQILGIKVGSELVMTVENDRATLTSTKASRRQARELVRSYSSKKGEKLSEKLLAERKAEARRE